MGVAGGLLAASMLSVGSSSRDEMLVVVVALEESPTD